MDELWKCGNVEICNCENMQMGKCANGKLGASGTNSALDNAQLHNCTICREDNDTLASLYPVNTYKHTVLLLFDGSLRS